MSKISAGPFGYLPKYFELMHVLYLYYDLFIQAAIICHVNHHNIPLSDSLFLYVLVSLLKEMRIYHPKVSFFDTKSILN